MHHLENYLFVDDPKFCNADRFALPVTYWKDSWIPNRKNFEPVYPISYFLAHAQNMAAIRSASKILKSKALKKYPLK